MLFTSNAKSFALSFLALAALPAARSATLNVTVGGTGALALKFDPEFVIAQPGDLIRFIFKQKNHTATQSTFASPCSKAPSGFDSGFVSVLPDVTDNFPIAELPISDTNPIWVYCAQGTHCSAAGMVFAINPADKFAAFKAAATGAAASTSVPSTPSTTLSAPTTSSTATGTDHKITVGAAAGLTFSPSNITAKVGDTITFEFLSKNHTVTASSFAAPCVPLSQTSSLETFFDSGYQPVAAGATTFPKFTIKVNDTRPIWAYCKQGNHCGAGMVFSANADETGARGFGAFQDLAKQLNGTGATTGNGSTGGTTDNGASQQAIPLRSAGAAIAALVVSAFLL